MQPSPSLLRPLRVLLVTECRLNIKPLKTSFASKKKPTKTKPPNGQTQRKGRAGQEAASLDGDESVPLSCVQGNTDPAPAGKRWLHERWLTAEVMRRNSGQRLLLGACSRWLRGDEPALPLSSGSPGPSSLHTPCRAAGQSGQAPAGGCSDPGNGLERVPAPTSQGSSNLPSQRQARNSPRGASRS